MKTFSASLVAVLLLVVAASTAPAITIDDFYAHWTFDETSGSHYYDSSNNGSHATFGVSVGSKIIPVSTCPDLNASYATRAGASGTGTGMMLGYDQLVIDGKITTSLIDIPFPDLNPLLETTDYAISLWLADDDWTHERGVIAAYNEGAGMDLQTFTIGINNKQLVAAGVDTNIRWTTPVTGLTGYHHVLAQFNSGSVSALYVDGILVDNTEATTAWVSSTTPGLTLGARVRPETTNSSYPITGMQLDDFAIINGTVTPEQALAIATAGASIDNVNGLSLHTHLKLDETSGSTLVDSTGNGNDGRLVQWSVLNAQDVSGATATGMFGAGAEFDRANLEFAQIIPNSLPVVGDEAFTTMFWMKAADWTLGGTVLAWDDQENRCTVGLDGKGEFRVYLVGTDGQKIRYLDVDENGLNLTDNEFLHFAVTVDEDSNISLYLNGVLQTLLNSSATRPAALNTACIGALSTENMTGISDTSGATTPSTAPITGVLDDLAVISGVLTEAQIQYAMANGVAALLSMPMQEIPGDATGDRKVDEEDAKRMASYWGATGPVAPYDTMWPMGDFNGDGIINAMDAAILAANWGDYTSGEATATAVPEPGVLGLLFAALFTMAGLRRRG